MNKRGAAETTGLVGALVMVAVLIIVGVVLLQASAQNVGQSTSTIAASNQSLTAAAVNGTAQYLTTCQALSDIVVWNATDSSGIFTTNRTKVDSGNYTVTNYAVNNGALAVRVMPTVSAAPKMGYERGVWQIQGVCEPYGYITDSGSRAIAGLIVIMFAIALAVVALTPTLRSGVLDALGK